MVDFFICEVEGMWQVCVDIVGEIVCVWCGVMFIMCGDIKLMLCLLGFGDIFWLIFISEVCICFYYSGSGLIMLQLFLVGYYLLDVEDGEVWIFEFEIYWVFEGDVVLGMWCEFFWFSLWVGDGLFIWKIMLCNFGCVVINVFGLVEVVDVDGELCVQGWFVLGWIEGLKFFLCFVVCWLCSMILGQKWLWVFIGKGKVLVCWMFYWNEYLYCCMIGESIEGVLLEQLFSCLVVF